MKPYIRNTALGVAAISFVIGGIGITSYLSTTDLVESNQWVQHTLEVTDDIHQLSFLLKSAQSDARAYFMSGEEYYSKERQDTIAAVPELFKHLRWLIRDNSNQLARLDKLEPMISDRMERWKSATDLYKMKGLPGIRELMRSADVKRRDQRLNELMNELVAEEKALLRIRTDRSIRTARRSIEVTTTGSVVAFLIVLFSLIEIIRHMLKRRRTEESLRETSETLAAMIHSSPLGILLLSAEQKIQMWNPACEQMFGWKSEEVVGKPLPFVSDVKMAESDGIFEVMRRTHQKVEIEAYRIRKNGTPIQIGISTIPLINKDNQIYCFMAVLSDITKKAEAAAALRDAKEQAVQMAKTKAAFLANMSHEIRTPLNGIIGMTDLLLDTDLDDLQEKYAKIVQDSGNGLLSIVNNILDFSKIEAGKTEMESIDFKPAELIEKQTDLLAHRANEQGLSLTPFIDPAIPRVLKGDPGKLGQILLNFLTNAIKFTKTGSIVVRADLVSKSSKNCEVRFSVRDSGIGLAKEGKTRLFQPFTQADGSTARKYGGTGLGLSICKRLVDLMGGEIGVDSELGQGATFWIVASFPVAVEGVEHPSAANTHGPLGRDSQLPSGIHNRILLVEDNPVNQLLAMSLLKNLGYDARSVSNGRAAVEAATHSQFDLILMDCQLPEMDGYEATTEIRKWELDKGLRIPVIALTANALSGEREKCLLSGMDDHLTKPVRKEELKEIIERWLTQPKNAA
jgi:PAS domain S-box-containing protein